MADKNELLDHDYDGIQEYDNDLPRWWVAIFWITALYGVFYVFYYHFGPGLLQEEQLAVDMKEIQELQAKQQQTKPVAEVDEAGLLALVGNAEAMEQGKVVFQAKCMACHGMNGEGLIGPNLTDDHWIHGGKITDIRKVVIEGVLEKGMLAWKGQLSDSEINNVVAYIWTLQGSNPPNPKAPEGELVVREAP
jgi:cytochrome c oxidase cbb3-type subunit III